MTQVADPIFSQYGRDIDGLISKYVSGSTFYGPSHPLIQARQLIDLLGRQGLSIRDRRFIDFGCGAGRPLTASSIAYLLGAAECLAIDIEEPYDLPSSALAIHALILAVVSGYANLDFQAAGTNLREVQQRSADFDMAALLSGDLWRGLPNGLQHRLCLYQDLSPEERRFDFMVSHSVFEHVQDLGKLLDDLGDNISPDGFIYTNVDYRDHRCFSQGTHPWQYLIDDGDHSPGYINKIRHSAMIDFLQLHSWNIIECERSLEPIPQHISEKIIPKYNSLPIDDLNTLSAAFLLRQAA